MNTDRVQDAPVQDLHAKQASPASNIEAIDKPSTLVREIDEVDIPELVNLTLRGFEPPRPRAFWEDFFSRLGRRSVPAGYPRYGYVLVHADRLVGVIILIYSTTWIDGVAKIRCNGSTVYTEPEFRCYAPFLYARPHKDKNVTTLILTAIHTTHKMIEAMGYTKYADGVLATVPLLSRPSPGTSPRLVDAKVQPDAIYDPWERELLLEHADFGCISFWCVADGHAYPFVFRPRKLKSFLPVAQLVYCRDLASFAKFSRPIGFYLAKRLNFIVLLQGEDPFPGISGMRYGKNRPFYFRGPDRPRSGDLAYTEISMLGI